MKDATYNIINHSPIQKLFHPVMTNLSKEKSKFLTFQALEITHIEK